MAYPFVINTITLKAVNQVATDATMRTLLKVSAVELLDSKYVTGMEENPVLSATAPICAKWA